MFSPKHRGNGNDDISSKNHFENTKTRRCSYLILETISFCLNILILYRDPVPLKFVDVLRQ